MRMIIVTTKIAAAARMIAPPEGTGRSQRIGA